ncbi:hypothetical protein [Deinococcus hopiensis]|nr:hypothetical protein [Deinococcus hopiensis]
MNDIQTERHEALVRATRPGMVQPQAARLAPSGASKRLYREVKAAYSTTHSLLAELSYETHYTPKLICYAVDNHCRAEALLSQGRALPRTFLGARVRSAALDNESVAPELLEVIAHTANRAPELN